MELLFNIFWVLIAIGICVFGIRHNRNREDAPGVFTGVVAIACVVFLLFPCISISDDLHDVNGMFEDSARKSISAFVHIQPLVMPAVGLLALSEAPQISQALLWHAAEESAAPRTLDGFVSLAEGRAPPTLSLL